MSQRRARFAVLALVIAWFVLPYGIRAWIPVWLPFLAALALELQFFVGGLLRPRAAPATPNRGPQERDLEDFGWFGEPEDDEFIAARRRDKPRWTRRHVVEAAAVLAVVCALLYAASRPRGWDAVSPANRTQAEALFSREAARIAGHHAEVRCDTSGDYVGVVQDADGLAVVGGTRAYVTPDICDTLYQLAFKHRVHSSSRTGRAIAVLAHEAWHLRGVQDEGLANCYAFQGGVQLGVRFGLAEERARKLMREQLDATPPDLRYVVPATCRDGGENDINRESRAFP
jgi:hypothetical protein